MKAQKPLFVQVSSQEVLFFTKHLATMIKAGIPLAEALEGLRDQASSSSLKYVLTEIHADVLNGQTLLQYSDRSVGEVVKQLAVKAGINKRVYTHLMRHCSFTHMVENGTDINLVQKLAGHSNVKTTMIYTHISHNHISKIQSPLSQIQL